MRPTFIIGVKQCVARQSRCSHHLIVRLCVLVLAEQMRQRELYLRAQNNTGHTLVSAQTQYVQCIISENSHKSYVQDAAEVSQN